MHQFNPVDRRRRLAPTRACTALILIALAVAGVGCDGVPAETGDPVEPSTVRRIDIAADSLRLQLEAKMSQRQVLQRELEAVEAGLADAVGRYETAKSAPGASSQDLRTEVQTKRSEVAKIRARVDALDSEIERLTERYNSSQ